MGINNNIYGLFIESVISFVQSPVHTREQVSGRVQAGSFRGWAHGADLSPTHLL